MPTDAIDANVETKDTPLDPPVRPEPRPSPSRRPGWERKLPKRYTVAASPGGNSLRLPLELEAVDNALKVSLNGLLDCGATSEFIDSSFVLESGIPVRRLSQPIPIFNVDGSPNEAGAITEIADVVLRYNGHSERVQFAVTRLGKEKLILGMSWLRKHNPEVNWETGRVSMTRCPTSCTTCRDDARKERREAKLVRRILSQLRAGPFPTICAIDAGDPEDGDFRDGEFPEDMPDLPDLTPDSDDDDDALSPVQSPANADTQWNQMSGTSSTGILYGGCFSESMYKN